jgi:ornithine cyclodeaminase/alanine dehydrogenase-like protein (mu-crystallin family)
MPTVLNEAEIRSLITPQEALESARLAFSKLARGEVEQPEVITLEFPHAHGEFHGKAGYLHGAPYFTLKAAGGFYQNAQRGLPSLVGSVFVFSAETGMLEGLLLDNGYLTERRTAAAGALASDLLARREIRTLAVIGSSGQARFQLEAHLAVRQPEKILTYSKTRANSEKYAREMQDKYGLPVAVVASVKDAVEQAELVVTATSAKSPLVMADWIKPGTHITAIGSDMPGKVELEPALLAKAKIFCDRRSQVATQGEVHHALDAGLIVLESVIELGDVVNNTKPGRASEDDITVADLTGVGVLDAAIANVVMTKALEKKMGQRLSS